MKLTFYVRQIAGGYELRQLGEKVATQMADKSSALWAANALCSRTGGTIVLQNMIGETVSTKRVSPRRVVPWNISN